MDPEPADALRRNLETGKWILRATPDRRATSDQHQSEREGESNRRA